jgi:hypothetical protein
VVYSANRIRTPQYRRKVKDSDISLLKLPVLPQSIGILRHPHSLLPILIFALHESTTMRRSTSKESASTADAAAHRPAGASSVVSYLANTLLKEKPAEPTPATSDDESSGENIFYLAYGSNLARKTFLDMRGIRPLSQRNVHCPSLTLTFDLGPTSSPASPTRVTPPTHNLPDPLASTIIRRTGRRGSHSRIS